MTSARSDHVSSTGRAVSGTGPRRRRDALENEERVLAAAVTTMLRDGRQVPMSAIAAEAGVGVGTLYRKYPNRDALLFALTERSLVLLAELAVRVVADDGAGLEMLSRWWDQVIEVNDQLVLPLRGGPAVFTARAAAARQRLHDSLRTILRTGRRDGSIRRDATLADVIHFGTMLATPFHGTPDQRRIVRRQKAIHLDGLAGARRSESGTSPS